jgi:quercetin dioxygenase-like cupin family protein
MIVTRFNTAPSYEPEQDWKRVSLCAGDDISIEHFVKPPGHSSPRHNHPQAQILVVLEGQLCIEVDHQTPEILNKGDSVYIPGDEMHIISNPLDSISVGLDIFVPGRSFDFWLNRKTAQ